jgi:hypothetical protein
MRRNRTLQNQFIQWRKLVQPDELSEMREDRDVTETEMMLALVGVEQPTVLYRIDVHRWTSVPLKVKMHSSMSSSVTSGGTTQEHINNNVTTYGSLDAERTQPLEPSTLGGMQVGTQLP